MIRPTKGRLVLKEAEQKEFTESGLYLPNSARSSMTGIGEVVACNLATEEERKLVKKGSLVVFDKYTGGIIEIELNGEKYILTKAENILGVFEEKMVKDGVVV